MHFSAYPPQFSRRKNRAKHTPVACLLIFMLGAGLTLANPLGLTDKILDAVAKEYGRRARSRLLSWQHMVSSSADLEEQQKLIQVNDFFNRIRFVADQNHWQKTDYWATPIEFLATDGGDCEDFAIAKYITLRALNVPDDKLRITYVKALTLNQAHMVLTYYDSPSAIPSVLDNLDPIIKTADKRTDLQPVYSFNGDGLWLAKMRGEGQKMGSSSDLNMWRDLVERLQKERTSS
tara:strand:+ start:37758 stop:38459 length:702 start_codon:yes stop_codon:yes gene_type:complete